MASISRVKRTILAGDDIEDQLKAIVKESMEDTLKQIIPEVPFVAEPEIADARG